jgi:hypothetical protein
MTLFRIPFILSAAFAMHITVTPPNPPPEETEQVKQTGSEYIFARWSPAIAKVRRGSTSCAA